jgi:hypothetical protein
MFSLAFPLVPLLAFLNNIVEMLIDKKKILTLTRRPFPVVAKSNGIFTHIFAIIAFLCVFTNLGIMSFTGKTFGTSAEYTSFLWFVIGALFFKFTLSETIPDISESTYNVMQRHKNVVRKALANMFRQDDMSKFKVERINLDVLFTEKVDSGDVDRSTKGLLDKDNRSGSNGSRNEEAKGDDPKTSAASNKGSNNGDVEAAGNPDDVPAKGQ